MFVYMFVPTFFFVRRQLYILFLTLKRALSLTMFAKEVLAYVSHLSANLVPKSLLIMLVRLYLLFATASTVSALIKGFLLLIVK